MIEQVWIYTGRPRLSELRDALGGHNPASLEMHLDDVIERVWRCTWTTWSSMFEDALGRHHRASLEDALGGHDQASLEMHLEAMIVRDWRSTCSRPMGGGWWEAVQWRRTGCWDSIPQLVNSQLWECGRGIFTFELSWRAGWWSCMEARWKLKLYSGVNL